MKAFKPTYLYVKTHLVTGLKYFGKTTKADPHRYRGSGLYWMRHCRKHGWLYKTRIIGYFTCREECLAKARSYSKRHDIVHAVNPLTGKKAWANSIPENGLDGGPTTFGPRPKSFRQRMSLLKTGSTLSEETKEKIRQANLGKKHSLETRLKMSRSQNRPSTLAAKRKALTGRKQSPETIEKRRQKLLGVPRSPETRRKISEGHLRNRF